MSLDKVLSKVFIMEHDKLVTLESWPDIIYFCCFHLCEEIRANPLGLAGWVL